MKTSTVGRDWVDDLFEKVEQEVDEEFVFRLLDLVESALLEPHDAEQFEKFIGNVKSQEFLGNIVRYIVNIKDHLLILDTLHEADKKIYSSNEEITFYLDAEKIKFL